MEPADEAGAGRGRSRSTCSPTRAPTVALARTARRMRPGLELGRRGMSDGAEDEAIRALVGRLARRQPSGALVIERAAILAEGADCAAVVAWIRAHAGQPEAALSTSNGGLHGSRLSHHAGAANRPPARYVLPAGALT